MGTVWRGDYYLIRIWHINRISFHHTLLQLVSWHVHLEQRTASSRHLELQWRQLHQKLML